MPNKEPILGDMQIVDMGGSHIALFKNLNQWTGLTVRHFHASSITTVDVNSKPYIGYTHGALFGIGRNPLMTRIMHPDDQQKITDAKNAMIEIANQKRQQNTIDLVGATGLVKPRI